MYSIETIRAINAEDRVHNSDLVHISTPEQATQDYVTSKGGFKHAPESYLDRDDEIELLFVDSSGFGASYESALTQGQFFNRLRELVTKHGEVEVGITEAGQFQVYVGVWPVSVKSRGEYKTVPKSRFPVFQYATATSIFDEDGDRVLKHHHTNVVRFNEDRVVLNSGGFRTVTTKKRFNQAAQGFDLGYSVFQKNFDWFVRLANGDVIPFEDGIEIQRGGRVN